MAGTLTTIIVLAAFGLLLSLAYAAERQRDLRWVVYGIVALLDLSLIPFGLLFAAAGALTLTVPEANAAVPAGMGEVTERVMAAAPQFGGVLIAVGVVGLIALLPPVRRLVARLLPMDADRVVHAVSLQYVVYLVGVSALTALIVSAFAADDAGLDALTEMAAESGGLSGLWAQSLGFVLLAVFGVGLGVQRDWRGTLDRLGLTPWLSVRWWLAATALGLAGGFVLDLMWAALAGDNLQQVERVSEALFAPYLEAGLLSALTIGLSAGLGEEILFRGAAQPRLGLIFTSLLFATVHTQYTVSPALLQVFLVGLLLGITRYRTNTTTSIAVHSTYNFVLVVLALYVG